MKNPHTDEEIYHRYLEVGTIRGTARALGVSVGKVHKVVHNPPLENRGTIMTDADGVYERRL